MERNLIMRQCERSEIRIKKEKAGMFEEIKQLRDLKETE